MLQQIPEDGSRFLSFLKNGIEEGQGLSAFSVENMMGQVQDLVFSREAQKVIDFLCVQHAGLRGRSALVQKGQGITETTVRPDGDEISCIFGEGQIAFFGDMEEMIPDIGHRNAMEFIPLAAGKDGQRNLFRLRGGQDEKDVGRRFFQRLQEGVEGLLRQHVDFIDDIDFFAACRGKGPDRFLQRPDFLDAPVRSGIDFINVQRGPAVDFFAAPAFIAGVRPLGIQAVHRFGQDFGHTGLAGTPGTGEKVGVSQPVLLDGPLERNGNMFLPHHFRKSAGTPFSVKCEVSHESSLEMILERKFSFCCDLMNAVYFIILYIILFRTAKKLCSSHL